jgi:hypothetical protein
MNVRIKILRDFLMIATHEDKANSISYLAGGEPRELNVK